MVNKKYDLDMVGILAPEEYVEEKIGRPSIFVNSQNVIQFNIKIISETPDSFPNVNLISAFASTIESYGYEDLYTDPRQRRESLREFLDDFLIVFQPVRKLRSGGSEVYQASEIRLHPKTSGFNENTTFVPVPIFSEHKHGYGYEEFMLRVWTSRFVGRIDNFSTEQADTPTYVLWKDEEDQSFTVLGEFDKHRYAHGGFSFLYNELKVMKFREEWFEDAFEEGDILFVGSETYRQMGELMKQQSAETLPEGSKESEEQAEESKVMTPLSVPAAKVEQLDQTVEPSDSAVKEEVHRVTEEKSEDAFIEHFIQMTRDRSLLYAEKDLINFHTAMKSSTLVILAGMSGTGKSRLVDVYGRALGMDEHQLTIIPVRPSWTDDADLIGYVDSIHNVYRPGDSGLINTLIQAQKDENKHNKMYIVCFDEMNLARVEHYFSQFLSVLEMPAARRQLRLYNEELEARLYNSSQYPSTITIGENVMFVGTVNLDESTYHFSDKVLDRANVIELNVMPFRQLKDLKERKPERKEWTMPEYRAFKSQTDSVQLSEQELEFFEALHETLETYKGQGVGHRIVRQVDVYLKNLPQRDALSRQEAFDLQIVQRVFTKLRGPEDQLKPLLGVINLETGELKSSRLIELLDVYQDISPFVNTRQTIMAKAKELKLHGYTV